MERHFKASHAFWQTFEDCHSWSLVLGLSCLQLLCMHWCCNEYYSNNLEQHFGTWALKLGSTVSHKLDLKIDKNKNYICGMNASTPLFHTSLEESCQIHFKHILKITPQQTLFWTFYTERALFFIMLLKKERKTNEKICRQI